MASVNSLPPNCHRTTQHSQFTVGITRRQQAEELEGGRVVVAAKSSHFYSPATTATGHLATVFRLCSDGGWDGLWEWRLATSYFHTFCHHHGAPGDLRDSSSSGRLCENRMHLASNISPLPTHRCHPH